MRVALRISRRDAVRAKGRTALIMVMIGLPVLVITGLLTFAATADVTVKEGLVRDLGAADLRIKTTPYSEITEQYGDSGLPGPEDSKPKRAQPTTTAEVAARLQPGTRLIGFDEGSVDVWRADQYEHVAAVEIDLRDPLARGVRPLVEGRYPAGPDEVVVTRAMPFRPGDTIKVTRANRPVRVVGVVSYPFNTEHMEVVGSRGVLLLDKRDGQGTGWLADTPSPATLSDTRRLNEVGLVGLSSLTTDDDPLMSMMTSTQVLAVALVVFMVVAETALLAGPAFAIGLRRRRTELAMIAAQGGSKAHLRAIVLADGLVLGGTAAVPAAVVGTAAGLLLVPLLSDSVGPAEVPWWQVLGVAALGSLSGMVAALVPALQAARQDTAAVLSGRSGAARDRTGKPVLGLVLLAAGVVASVAASRTEEVWIFAAAVLGQLGMVAVMPWLVRFTGRLAVRLPLTLRLSVRDAVRHRVRTASAVAAVMTATAGAVAAGIGVNSQYVDQRDSYRAPTPVGTLSITAAGGDDAEWAKIRTTAARLLPGVTLASGYQATTAAGESVALLPRVPITCRECTRGVFFNLQIGDQGVLDVMLGRHDPAAAAALAAGKAVVFDPALARNGMLSLNASGYRRSVDDKGFVVPAVVVKASDPRLGGALLPPAAVTAQGWKLQERELFTRHPVPDIERLHRELSVVSPYAGAGVASGFQSDIDGTLLALMGGALILVLGGTFVATALAAADMRPDLATVSAVGAPAKTGRLVVAGQAGYIAGLGALVGAVAGVVPGVALAWAMTTAGGTALGFGPFMVRQDPGPATIAVPWSLVGVVVIGLPLLAALVAGAFARTGTLTLTRRLT
ncbi:FtsX-like permease family protein [Nonomuraea sp. bgisy101]|uniref:ABC transporter permease n=1 Tax=Nonomuraea sp. bgisy101 TaxID=3413784 RepID=UPI003D72BB56